MGRIKSTLIKRTGTKLMEDMQDFTTIFDENKKMLGSTMPSKKVRNKIAGYITRKRTYAKQSA